MQKLPGGGGRGVFTKTSQLPGERILAPEPKEAEEAATRLFSEQPRILILKSQTHTSIKS